MSFPIDTTHFVSGYRGKLLLVQTWHRGIGSVQTELAAWKARYDRGEVTHVEVVDRMTGKIEKYPPWGKVK